ncbi:prostaglandin D2 receptor 2-like [Cololabis saira]|uniref:prostaglandin D2 receptor 2-like n=1 Tax=Cololabis saira TaxID=129043 RepID=UPI002AD4DD09|nr:prostaglandin D2 receptor 2-like [Cololabis saira]
MMDRHSNQTTNGTTRMSSLDLFTISLHGMVSTIGIIENLLILGVVAFHVRRSVISIWILNLAASDLLATASLPFFTVYLARGSTWTMGRSFCCIHSSIFFLNMFVSGFLLAAISMDRCLMVLKPVWSQNYRNIKLVSKICAVIWAMAVICTIPFYMFRDIIPTPSGKILCYYNYKLFPPHKQCDMKALENQRKQGLAFMKFFMAFLIPLFIIVSSYVAVSTSLARRGCQRPFRFVRLVFAVVVSFIVCWAPYHIFILMEILTTVENPVNQFAKRALPVATTIGFLNSVLNPVLYVFSCPDLCRKIRHSLGAVMESVLAEDLVELTRRRSTVHSAISNSETGLRKKSSVAMLALKGEEQVHTESFSN